MARTKSNKQRRNKTINRQTKAQDSTEIEELIDLAEQSLASSDFDRSIELCQKVISSDESNTRALETLALTHLELGDVKSALEFFQKCLTHSQPNTPAAVHLYLAQLVESPHESLKHFEMALDNLKTKLSDVIHRKSKQDDQQDDYTNEESEIRRSCSRALVGMTEIYLTDLCFEDSAEQKCLEFLANASSTDPTDPEPLQTLASVRISQSDITAAKDALLLSLSLWNHKNPTETQEPKQEKESLKAENTIRGTEEEQGTELPGIETRIQWCKLAIECEMWNESIEVLQICESEDDEDGEIQYLLAISWYFIGQNKSNDVLNIDDHQISKGFGLSKFECWMESRECLESCLKLYERLGDSSGIDQTILDHIKQLLIEFDQFGISSKLIQERGQEDDPNDDDEDQDVWEDASDVEMND